MSSGAARLVVVLVFAAGCGFVLAKGFSANSGDLARSSPSASPTHHPHTRSPQPTLSPKVSGVTIAVFNGTNTPNLASHVQQTLAKAGYRPDQTPGNSPTQDMTQTIVYYRTGATASQTAQSKANAEWMAQKYFPTAKVMKLGANQTTVAPTVQLAVFLGSDYHA
jgi:LytR cell envelope-related transcriptional attenuator